MYPPVAQCREQEVLQLDRAANTALPKVRAVADRAAMAWRIEAGWAEKRERREATQIRASASGTDLAMDADQKAEDLSENPDRGRADPPSPQSGLGH